MDSGNFYDVEEEDGLLSRHPGTLLGLNCRSQSPYALPSPNPSPMFTGHIRPNRTASAFFL